MNPSKVLLLVGFGGFFGSASRYFMSVWLHGVFPATTFPIGTLAVNVLGCLMIGVLGGLFETRQAFGPEARLFLMVGVLGGFTTFSSFAFETLALARDAEFLRAFANIAFQTVFGLVAAWLGYALVRP
jgi:CrcB protein